MENNVLEAQGKGSPVQNNTLITQRILHYEKKPRRGYCREKTALHMDNVIQEGKQNSMVTRVSQT